MDTGCKTMDEHTVFAISIKISEEACEVFKKSVTIYRVERVLYKYLACVNITADSDLHGEILSKIDGSSQYLEITNSSIPEITREMFQTLNLTQITIEAKVQIIQERTFERANISNVILDNNEIKKVKDNAFKSFAIYVLNMKNNSLSEITKNTFTGLVNLRKLSLQNNFISNIQPDSFNDLSAVNELNLASNRLSELPAKLFNKMRNLQTIYSTTII
ncbi:Slit-like protein 1 [Gonioctena quinquepunctata]|nr:Slit-like protein 1 [Gonioctena quinquepunctata]